MSDHSEVTNDKVVGTVKSEVLPETVRPEAGIDRRKLFGRLAALAGLGITAVILSQEKTGILPDVVACGNSSTTSMTFSDSGCGYGVQGGSSSGVGVLGIGSAPGATAVLARVSDDGALPLVAQGATPTQYENLQEWQGWQPYGNTQILTPFSAVDAHGSLGVGTGSSSLIPASTGGNVLQLHAATNENFVSRDANIGLGQPPGTFQGVSFQGVNDANSANNMLAFIGSPIALAGGNVFIGGGPPTSLSQISHQITVQAGAYCTGTQWVNACDKELKENFAPIDEDEILERLEAMPIQKWNYKDDCRSIQHVGPVAQDFYAAFRLGEGDKAISTVDADGVTFAAIKALHKALKDQESRIEQKSLAIAALERENIELQARLLKLERSSQHQN